MIAEWFKKLDNPVLVKEMRVGFREKKVFYALIAWVIIVALVASFCALGAFKENQQVDNLPESGIYFMEVLFWVQLGLLAMLAPSLTTSAVSGEKERNSFDMLLTTHLAPSELVFGKFGFAASFIVLALFATVPLESIVFFLGGVSLKSFLYSKLILVTFGFLCSLYGLMMSARETRSSYATGQTYLGLVFICFFGAMALGGLRYSDQIPGSVYFSIGVTLLYLGLFLYWKSVNHLEERARHLNILLSIGLTFYLLFMGIAAYIWQTDPNFDDEIWVLAGPIHYFLFGLMLNPMRPSRRIERERFSHSLLSRPHFWGIVLSAGLILPMFGMHEDEVIAVNLYALMAGLSTAVFARGLAGGREKRFPQILGASWLLLNVLPAFAIINGVNPAKGAWTLSSLSPMVMLVAYSERDPSTLPFLAMLTYSVLFVIGILVGRSRSRVYGYGES